MQIERKLTCGHESARLAVMPHIDDYSRAVKAGWCGHCQKWRSIVL